MLAQKIGDSLAQWARVASAKEALGQFVAALVDAAQPFVRRFQEQLGSAVFSSHDDRADDGKLVFHFGDSEG